MMTTKKLMIENNKDKRHPLCKGKRQRLYPFKSVTQYLMSFLVDIDSVTLGPVVDGRVSSLELADSLSVDAFSSKVSPRVQSILSTVTPFASIITYAFSMASELE